MYRQEEPATIANATVAAGSVPATTTLAAPVQNSVEYLIKETNGGDLTTCDIYRIEGGNRARCQVNP